MKLLRRSLFLRVSLAFVALAVIFGYLQIALFLSLWNEYNEEAEQRVFWDLASSMAEKIQHRVAESADHHTLQRELHQLVTLNPSVEPYLVDAQGKVVAGLRERDMETVEIGPLKAFLASTKPPSKPLKLLPPYGVPPKPQVFSVAPLTIAGAEGYLLIFLKGRWATEVRMHIGDLYTLRLSVTAFSFMMIFTVALAGIVFFFITRNFLRMSRVLARFEAGDHAVRVRVSGEDEVSRLGSAFNRMADTIEQTIFQLARSDELRRELVANITHDIRRPITSLHAKLQAFLSQYRALSEAEQIQLLESLIRALDGMNLLIDDLFELSKLNADERKPSIKSIELAPLVDDVCERFRHKAEARQITLAFHSPARPSSISSDPMLLDRVLSNLIENALLYTPSGGSIEVHLVSEATGIILTVRDTGVGIAPEDLPHIFDRFYRAQSAHEQVPGGSGLGLAIVKKIPERLGISISVESGLGTGTTFTLRF